jgi:hypothetical protein
MIPSKTSTKSAFSDVLSCSKTRGTYEEPQTSGLLHGLPICGECRTFPWMFAKQIG